MEKKRIWLSSPHLGEGEFEYVKEAFATNWIAPLGPHVDQFEKDLGKVTQSPYVAALSSGTAAIHLSLILENISPQDEVLVSSFTFAATANPIAYEKALPVFIESEKDTWNMCPAALEEAILARKALGKTPKAIIAVHLYGMPAKISDIVAIGERYGIPVIEDAAEALGSTFNGTPVGSFGEFGILSFNGNKIITTSGGGALLGKSKEKIEKARFLATQARDNAPHYQHSHIGYNYRLSNVLAGIGRGQLEVLPNRIAQRRRNFDYYKARLGAFDGVHFLAEPEGLCSNRWLTTVEFSSYWSKGESFREKVRMRLLAENIESRPLWKPLHLQPVFEGCPYFGDRTSEALFARGLCLPSGSNLSEEDLESVCTIVEEVLHEGPIKE